MNKCLGARVQKTNITKIVFSVIRIKYYNINILHRWFLVLIICQVSNYSFILHIDKSFLLFQIIISARLCSYFILLLFSSARMSDTFLCLWIFSFLLHLLSFCYLLLKLKELFMAISKKYYCLNNTVK